MGINPGRSIRSRPVLLTMVVIGTIIALGAAGCGFSKLKKDVDEIETAGIFSGSVEAEGGTAGVYVVLFAETAAGPVVAGTNRLSELMNTWVFTAEVGTRYWVAGFRDLDGDERWSSGEPAGILGMDEPLVMTEQSRVIGLPLELKPGTVIDKRFMLDANDMVLDDEAGLQLVAGDIIDFDDKRFSAAEASDGMWSPLTMIKRTGAGIYFLDEYDPEKIPVLFVHGLGGSPAEFRAMAEGIDLERYQPWFFHYPSGFRLYAVGRMLKNMVFRMQEKLGFGSICVVAYSMGGLVSRSAILQAERNPRNQRLIRVFVTIATPLEGHAAAEYGLKFTPEPVPAWIDMAPGSVFLESIRKPLPERIPYYILFAHRRGGQLLMSGSHDTVVSVMSQIPLWAQEEAVRIRGYDEDHVSVLTDDESMGELVRILDEITASD